MRALAGMAHSSHVIFFIFYCGSKKKKRGTSFEVAYADFALIKSKQVPARLAKKKEGDYFITLPPTSLRSM